MRHFVLLTALACVMAAGAQKKMTVNLSSGETVTYDRAEVDSIVFAFEEIDIYRGHEYVDLGLPSGLKWATCNIGAEAPEENGSYYAWAETEPRERYGNDNRYIVNSKITKYNTDETLGKVDGLTTLEPDDDVAHVMWGGPWRMPTMDDFTELTTSCTCQAETVNSVKGYLFTGPNGNSIFMPKAGYYAGSANSGSLPLGHGSQGNYWSSSLYQKYSWFSGNCKQAFVLQFSSTKPKVYYMNRMMGLPVRPVAQ